MTYFSKILLYLIIGFLAMWQLPWCYNFLAVEGSKSGFTLYSSILDDFVFIKHSDAGAVRKSLSGKEFTQNQFDSILPTFYLRQLVTDGRFPDTIKGIPVEPKMVQQENFNYRCVPSDINRPKIGLYSLLESMSKRVDLVMPDDVFRLTDSRIEFIDMKSNSINENKSQIFTAEMKKQGLVFPVKTLSGNPTTRKEYDEGYVMLDANNNVFHVKMTVGRPFVRSVKSPKDVTLKHLFITEFRNRKTLALITDTENKLYVLSPNYKITKVDIPSYDPKLNYITIMGNMFDWTIRITSKTEDNYYAIDNNTYQRIKEHKNKLSSNGIPTLSFTSSLDKFVKPRF